VNKIKTIIIDDERLAREEIKTLISTWENIEIVAEAKNAIEAEKIINDHQPDLLFLDIQMPQRNGFELLESLDEAPEVIFVTAFDNYAIEAFNVSALDYIVKPIRKERFDQCIQKAIAQIKTSQLEKKEETHQIFVKDAKKCYFIKLIEISYIKSIGNYAQLHFNNQSAMVKRTINYLEKALPTNFFRCNRSEIINHQFISSIEPLPKGALRVHLTTKQIIDLSERRSVVFKEKLKL
jgi:two-component system LytT family response regulator